MISGGFIFVEFESLIVKNRSLSNVFGVYRLWIYIFFWKLGIKENSFFKAIFIVNYVDFSKIGRILGFMKVVCGGVRYGWKIG